MVDRLKKFEVCVESEIGELEGVILHTPGPEVENMTPGNVERALYSDILNLAVANDEYSQLRGVLDKVTQTFQVKKLLGDVLGIEKVKETLVEKICINEAVYDLQDYLLSLPKDELAAQLLEGVVMEKNTLSRFLNKDYYALQPLHNSFYTRDPAIAQSGWVLVARMASRVRERETIIIETIFDSHPFFNSKTENPMTRIMKSPDHLRAHNERITIEGGDVLVARKDILIIGIGSRTTAEGVDFIVEQCNKRKETKHIIVQELPETPESFIHLDMVFTFLDRHHCMVYEPIIVKPNRFQTVHISLENGSVASIKEDKNILDILKRLGMDIEPLFCGGSKDSWLQEREQWHSGCNFFAVAPGKVLGYGRNVNTIEEMNRHGFEVIQAKDVIRDRVNPGDFEKYVITIHGSELSRGGGGCRCMTMPVRRKPLD